MVGLKFLVSADDFLVRSKYVAIEKKSDDLVSDRFQKLSQIYDSLRSSAHEILLKAILASPGCREVNGTVFSRELS